MVCVPATLPFRLAEAPRDRPSCSLADDARPVVASVGRGWAVARQPDPSTSTSSTLPRLHVGPRDG